MAKSLDIGEIMAKERKQIRQNVKKELIPYLDGIRGLGASREFKIFKDNYNY